MGQILESEIKKKEEKAGIEHPRKSGASEFQLLPPQLQHLRNSCLLQYILLVITQMYTHTFMVTRTKV